jgi:hypothetical protein
MATADQAGDLFPKALAPRVLGWGPAAMAGSESRLYLTNRAPPVTPQAYGRALAGPYPNDGRA